MEINIKWFNDQFNISLASKAGAEEFLTIRGCRIMASKDTGEEFVSMPATKGQNGKWWNHAFISKPFGEAVLKKAKEGMPQAEAPKSKGKPIDEPDKIPF